MGMSAVSGSRIPPRRRGLSSEGSELPITEASFLAWILWNGAGSDRALKTGAARAPGARAKSGRRAR